MMARLLVTVWATGTFAADRPNIVMIFTDDQGWNDVGCFGSEIPTPHIDSLARDGMKLTQFYAASSICTPSRFGLLTGRYPTRSQDQLLTALMFLSEADRRRGIRQGESTYVQKLRESGYTTALVGKWHLGHGDEVFWPTNHGFQTFFGHTGGCVDFFSLNYGIHPDWYRGRELVSPGKYATDAITDEAVAFLQNHQRGAAPFYLHVAYNAPHFGKAGNRATGEITNQMQPKPADMRRVDRRITDKSRRAFAAKVIGMDLGIGRILDQLDASGLSSTTLVIFMTDHGGDPNYGGSNQPFRGGKATLFEGGLRVPCLVRWPGQVAPGSQSDAVTCAIDWFPTLCGIAGIHTAQGEDGPGALDGLDIGRVLEGQSLTEPRELLWRTGSHAELGRNTWTALRLGKWKLVHAPDEKPMLFDMEADPTEQKNLATALPDQLRRLSLRAEQLLAEHD